MSVEIEPILVYGMYYKDLKQVYPDLDVLLEDEVFIRGSLGLRVDENFDWVGVRVYVDSYKDPTLTKSIGKASKFFHTVVTSSDAVASVKPCLFCY